MITQYKCSVTKYRQDQFCISLSVNGKRYRLYNGEPIGIPDKPNLLPVKQRYKAFKELLIQYHIAIKGGWSPEKDTRDTKDTPKILTVDYLYKVYEQKLQENLSKHFLKDFRSYISRIASLVKNEITEGVFQKMVDQHPHLSNTTFNTFVRYTSLIEKGLTKYGYTGSWSKKVKRRRKEGREASQEI